ncbi:hypothetical protein OPV22_001868 [Ensete ventricosum]|uniref:Uncharacterized protein n=1 Tax=Ensete ventricosum TaxID=4639 RepID=A0AAV8RWK1_ENSVE|nr:hypothetical protein OPV22_001868 [Ensete ventricosum]
MGSICVAGNSLRDWITYRGMSYDGADHVLRERGSICLVMMQSAPGLVSSPEQIRGVEVGVDAGTATCFPTLNLLPGRLACISAASTTTMFKKPLAMWTKRKKNLECHTNHPKTAEVVRRRILY